MKKAPEKLVLLALVLGLVIIGLLIALYSGTSRQRTDSVAAFSKTVPPALAKRLDLEADSLPADGPAQIAVEDGPAEDTIAAFEAFWPRLTAQNAGGSLWDQIEVRDGKRRGDPYDEEELAKILAFVAANHDFIDEIRRLAEMGGPVIGLDFSQGMGLELPHVARLRQMGRILRVSAVARAHEGDYAGAAEDILATLKLADAVAGEPVFISQLVRVAMGETASYAIRDALPPGACPPEALEPLLAYAAQADRRQGVVDGLTGHGLLGLVEFRRVREDGAPPGFDAGLVSDRGYVGRIASAVYTSPIGTPWVNMDEAAYAGIMARVAEANALPYYEARPIIAEIQEDIDTLPVTRFLSRALLPSVAQAAQAQARHEARLDLMQLGLLVEQHHAEHGAYPESLTAVADSLGGRVPLDPFTGAPYRYVLTDDGFTLYSLGRNLTDDGGLQDPKEGDIVWRGVETGD